MLDLLRPFLAQARLAPFRLDLEAGDFQPSAALLRGVWGAALRPLDRVAYDSAFSPTGHNAAPGYLLSQDPDEPSAFHWRLFGAGLDHLGSLCRAWDAASKMGLGPNRQRFLFRASLLDPAGQPVEGTQPWTLDRACWPLPDAPETTPCRLVFPAGLRLLRDGKLIPAPGFADIIVAALRRLRPLVQGTNLDALTEEALGLARQQPCCPWDGEKHRLRRWSARQQEEVEMRGVCGELTLPEGPGPLWPLLAAASWLHLGKGTTNGLGVLLVRAGKERRRRKRV